MHCEQANSLLVELASSELSTADSREIRQHLQQCATCQGDFELINAWRRMADNWHDEAPPPWDPSRLTGRRADPLTNLRLWFPTFASTAALLLAVFVYVQQPANTGTLPTRSTVADYQSLPELPKTQQAAVVDSVLASSRVQRQEELSALLKYLTAEMNRRSMETEESLRYIISSQIQDQQALDRLYQQVDRLLAQPAAASQSGVQQ